MLVKGKFQDGRIMQEIPFVNIWRNIRKVGVRMSVICWARRRGRKNNL